MFHWHKCFRWHQKRFECPFDRFENYIMREDPNEPEWRRELLPAGVPAKNRRPPDVMEEVNRLLEEIGREMVVAVGRPLEAEETPAKSPAQIPVVAPGRAGSVVEERGVSNTATLPLAGPARAMQVPFSVPQASGLESLGGVALGVGRLFEPEVVPVPAVASLSLENRLEVAQDVMVKEVRSLVKEVVRVLEEVRDVELPDVVVAPVPAMDSLQSPSPVRSIVSVDAGILEAAFVRGLAELADIMEAGGPSLTESLLNPIRDSDGSLVSGASRGEEAMPADFYVSSLVSSKAVVGEEQVPAGMVGLPDGLLESIGAAAGSALIGRELISGGSGVVPGPRGGGGYLTPGPFVPIRQYLEN